MLIWHKKSDRMNGILLQPTRKDFIEEKKQKKYDEEPNKKTKKTTETHSVVSFFSKLQWIYLVQLLKPITSEKPAIEKLNKKGNTRSRNPKKE